MNADQVTQDQLIQRLNQTEAFLTSDPGNTHLLATAIDLSLAVGDFGRADLHASAAAHYHPRDPFFVYRRGHVLVAQSNWSEAEALFAAVLAEHQNVNVAYSLADCQCRLGRHQDALATMQPYMDAPDLSAEAATLLVRAMHHVRDFAQADTFIEKHAERLHDAAVFLAASSLLYLDEGKLAESAALSDAALAAGSRPIEALVVNATLALANSHADAAIERFNEVLSVKPDEGRSWSGLGMASLLRRDLAGATVQLEQAVRYMPSHIGSWHALAWTHLFSNDMVKAEHAFQTALALDRNFGESHGGVAVIFALKGAREDAQAAMDRALRLDPQGLSARYAQMVLNGQTSDPERFRAIAYRLLAGRQTLSGENLADVVKRAANE